MPRSDQCSETERHMTELSSSKNISNIKAGIPTKSSRTSNSEDMISEDNKSSLNTEVSALSVSSSNLTYDRIYFCNKTLVRYPNLYQNVADYYGITDNTLCPLCRLDHGDDEIEGEYKNETYYIKCEQRIVQITA
ncbi:hypothetical protein C2G38_2051051 [Gigaspora rosea]|uniref:Uncharacterized protein n=1 Tax=Gigaspora rosea TaxID=44941 RepID=A0A397TUY8_9GLOM|nr:hypothetical protein C2G38_2051051 [Gigaspora rosea]